MKAKISYVFDYDKNTGTTYNQRITVGLTNRQIDDFNDKYQEKDCNEFGSFVRYTFLQRGKNFTNLSTRRAFCREFGIRHRVMDRNTVINII